MKRRDLKRARAIKEWICGSMEAELEEIWEKSWRRRRRFRVFRRNERKGFRVLTEALIPLSIWRDSGEGRRVQSLAVAKGGPRPRTPIYSSREEASSSVKTECTVGEVITVVHNSRDNQHAS